MKRTLLVLVLLVSTGQWCAAETRTVLVLPFANGSDRPDLHWISESFAETVAACLSGPSRYVVDWRERNAAYEGLNLAPGTPLTLASAFKVAEVLDANWAVTGEFNVEGERLTARARLLDVHRWRLAPPLEASGELADLVDLQVRLAWRLLAAHDPDFTVGAEEDFRRRLPPVRLDAFERHVRGLRAASAETRVQHLSEAHRLNPADRRAAWELGRHYFQQKDYEKCAWWLRKLDAKHAHYWEALFLLGVAELHLGRQLAAEMAFEALAEKVPVGEVWSNLGFVQAQRGRYTEALASFRRAYVTNPADPDFCFNLGVGLWHARRHKESVRYLEEARRMAADTRPSIMLPAALLDGMPDPGSDAEEQAAKKLLANLRLKTSYNARALRLLALAVDEPWQAKQAAEPVLGR